MIRFFLLQNKSGKTRLSKYYHPFADDEKIKMENEIHRIFMQRDASFTNFVEVCVATQEKNLPHLPRISTSFMIGVQYKSFKLVFRRYAGLFFIFAIDVTDNELLYLESIHLFVEVCVCFWLYKPCLAAHHHHHHWYYYHTMYHRSLHVLTRIYVQILDHYFGNVCELDLVFGFHRAYCILDEFIIGGEVQETSKKVILQRIKELDSLET